MEQIETARLSQVAGDFTILRFIVAGVGLFVLRQ
jgi:hypothetical protein